MSDAKQVATKKENLPSASLFEADAQAGFENVKTESLAPPILKLLQNGSAEAQKRNQNYVDKIVNKGLTTQINAMKPVMSGGTTNNYYKMIL